MHLRLKETGQQHQDITVYDTKELYGERGSFRVMQFSHEAVQGAMDLNDPKRIVLEYPRAIIHLMELNNPSFEDAFVIGHGIGTIAGHFPDKRFKAAELDGKVLEISRTHFGYHSDNVIIGDGRFILANEAPQTYDYVILDAFTAEGTPRHLVSAEFFGMAKEKLHSRGAIVMNLMGKGANDNLINAIHTTLGEHFPYTRTFALPAQGARDVQNVVIMGSGKPIRYQARHMAGFIEALPGQGHIIMDSENAT
ncbi:spermidine synthase [Gordoniibacillus kamchatkensis]|uniref:Spermidine synthase n=1 Tax=Gordoniibacillus kamchatkensis TaxID=1590651 RepID=A0ABR5AF03_9BACL|nr:fused MFS/spermidine synthase [Paenibacillus sp. VKM B-2647]KIL39643.1 spermidine synthase [Paenibacillus sp. VKM B-2647]